jgi:multidrug efflux pump subunit AcrA (membrane-fusion protein)
MMKKTIAVSMLLLFAVATLAFGHAGETHNYMGTVTTLHDDGSFMLKKTDGTTMHVLVAKTTTYLRADDKAATPADLKEGMRVVAKISKDGKTALSVKMAAPR